MEKLGMSPAKQDKAGTKIEGFGLGLAAVKAIVEAHGGKVLVQSEPGNGSVFTVILSVSPLENLDGK